MSRDTRIRWPAAIYGIVLLVYVGLLGGVTSAVFSAGSGSVVAALALPPLVLGLGVMELLVVPAFGILTLILARRPANYASCRHCY